MLPSRVLIVGNCIIDQIWKIPDFPTQDDELRALARWDALGGNACNSALILSVLGHQVELMTQLADDADAGWIREQLEQWAIDTSLCQATKGSRSPVSSIWLNAKNGSRTICHYRDLPELGLLQMQKIDPQRYQWIHFEGRNIEILHQYLSSDEHKIKIPISLEIEKPRARIEALLPWVKLVVVSNSYLKQRALSAIDCIHEFSAINPLLNIVCTLGDCGLIARGSDGLLIEIQAEPVENIVDSIGAGDCFIAGLVSRLIQQRGFKSALEFASKLAASKIQFQGMRFDKKLINE